MPLWLSGLGAHTVVVQTRSAFASRGAGGVELMGRSRSRSSFARTWFVALSAACLIAVALPLQLAGAAGRPIRDLGGGRDPGPGGDPTCLPDEPSCVPGDRGVGS